MLKLWYNLIVQSLEFKLDQWWYSVLGGTGHSLMGLIYFYTEQFKASQPDKDSVPSSSHTKPEPVILSKHVVKLCIHQSGDLAAKFEYNAVSGCHFCFVFLIQVHKFRVHCLFCEPCLVLYRYYSHPNATCCYWDTWSFYFITENSCCSASCSKSGVEP